MKVDILRFLKGLGMGAANVIPGVSGGTIALITGIYEELINSIKSVDLQAIKLLLAFKFQEFAERTNFRFLVAVFLGIGVSIVSLAVVLEYLLENQETLTMAFFFGLVLMSVYTVGKTVSKWSAATIVSLVIGTAIAIGIALMVPANENNSFFYLVLCGVVAICSMILPGLSGSFVLIIMGNYALVLGAVSGFDLQVLAPMGVGCVVGLVAFAQVLSWVFKNYRDQTISLMTGFVLGSLSIIWPWKDTLKEIVGGKEKIVKYTNWHFPEVGLGETWYAIVLILIGAGIILWMDISSGGEAEPA